MSEYRSFSKRLSSHVVSSTAVLIVLAFIIVGFKSHKLIEEESTRNAQTELTASINDVERVIESVEAAAHSMIWLIKEHLDDPDYMYRITRNLVGYNENIVGSTVAFEPDFFSKKGYYFAPYSFKDPETGEIQSIQMGAETYKYHEMEWYVKPKIMSGNVWCEPYFDKGGGEQMMTTYSVPLLNEEGEMFAVLTADVSLKGLTDKISRIKPFKNSYTILLGESGSFISHRDSSKILQRTIFQDAEEQKDKALQRIAVNMVGGKTGVDEFWTNDGKDAFIVYGPVSNGWSAAIVSAYSDVYARPRQVGFLMILVGILSLLVLYYIDRKLIGRISQPITEFTYSAMNIGKGNFKAHIPDIDTEDELKRLHDALQYMEKSIDSYIVELRQTMETNESMERDLNIASSIQSHMLPRLFPDNELVDLCAGLRPAKEVGGDMYDFYIKDNKLFFAVGDVSGKGVPAALYMAIARAAFRFISGLGLGASGVVSRMNNAFIDGNETNMFLTLFVAVIDLESGRMEYCNAGHNPIVIIRPDGSASYLNAKPNLAVGVFEDFPYEEESLQLEKGSRLIVYTDGVTEAENTAKELYGEDRLLEFASTIASAESSHNVVENLFASVKGFTKENSQNDDITILTVKLK